MIILVYLNSHCRRKTISGHIRLIWTCNKRFIILFGLILYECIKKYFTNLEGKGEGVDSKIKLTRTFVRNF